MLASQLRRKVIFENRVLTFMLLGKDDEANALLRNQTELANISCNFNVLLQKAAEWNSWKAAQRMIELDAEVEFLTPLSIAMRHNNFQTIKVLLEATLDTDSVDARGESVLRKVLRRSGNKILKRLFQSISPRIIGREKSFAEKLIAGGCSLFQAAFADNVKLLECMLNRGVPMGLALHGSISAGYLETTKWLVERGANVNARDPDGRSPLFIAALSCNKKLMGYLLKRGADPNFIDYLTGCTPLFAVFASASGFFDGYYSWALRADTSGMDNCVELLLRYGALPKNSNELMTTIFDCALEMKRPDAMYIVIAHLAMADELVNDRIFMCHDFAEKIKLEKYYGSCQKVLTVDVFDNLALVDLLNVSERKMKLLLRNELFISAVEKVCCECKLEELHLYYYRKLMKRISDGTGMLMLEDKAIVVICKIFNSNYNLCYDFGKRVVEYLNKSELERLCRVYE